MNDVARELLKIARDIVADDVMRESKNFVAEMQKMLDRYFEKEYDSKQGKKLEMTQGKRYIRIVAKNVYDGKVVENSGSAWAFIDKENGAILRPASWRKPAKHARGNVLDRASWNQMTVYGPGYLR